MSEEKPSVKKRSYRKVIIGAVVVAVIALALILGLVLGLRHHNSDNSNAFAQPWNNASQFLLSKNFTITKTPTTRYYDWTITQQTISPDGLDRPMLLVNGKCSPCKAML